MTDARDFNNIETRAVIFFLQGKAPKEIHAILTETLVCVLPGRAKDFSAPLYILTFRINFLSLSSTLKMDAENVISVFRREIADNRALLGYYAACSGNTSQTFRDNLSVPSSRAKNLRTVDFLSMQMEQMGNPETSVWNYH